MIKQTNVIFHGEILIQEALIELRDLHLPSTLGTYGPNDVIPRAHILDLTLTISAKLVRVFSDEMALVFDYDPLVAQIDELAQRQKYETQEFLLTLIATACSQYQQISAVEICLRKEPVKRYTGSLGVRIKFNTSDLQELRERSALKKL